MLDLPARFPIASTRHSFVLRALAGGLLGTAAAGSAFAQQPATYPSRAIRLIVAFAPGGPADIIARAIAPKMSELLGQSIVIDNRGGAGGTIGTEAGARAPADGYTLTMGGSSSLTFAPALYAKVSYDPVRDFTPISTVVITPYVIAVNPRVPAKSVADLVRLGRNSKLSLTYGSSGPGSTSHIGGELLSAATGLSMVHVPFKGTGPALAGVVTGEIDMMVADLGPVIGSAREGRLRMLAAFGSRRPSAAPELPTMSESGFKVPALDGRFGVLGPAGLQREIVNRLQQAVVQTIRTTEVRQRFDLLGYDTVGDTPEQYAQAIRNDLEVFGKVIREARIKPE